MFFNNKQCAEQFDNMLTEALSDIENILIQQRDNIVLDLIPHSTVKLQLGEYKQKSAVRTNKGPIKRISGKKEAKCNVGTSAIVQTTMQNISRTKEPAEKSLYQENNW